MQEHRELHETQHQRVHRPQVSTRKLAALTPSVACAGVTGERRCARIGFPSSYSYKGAREKHTEVTWELVPFV